MLGYLYFIVYEEDMLIILFFDYGFKMMMYFFKIMEGRGEIYDLLFFVIVLENVVNIFGVRCMCVMVIN